jgi:hypothetical protein
MSCHICGMRAATAVCEWCAADAEATQRKVKAVGAFLAMLAVVSVIVLPQWSAFGANVDANVPEVLPSSVTRNPYPLNPYTLEEARSNLYRASKEEVFQRLGNPTEKFCKEGNETWIYRDRINNRDGQRVEYVSVLFANRSVVSINY